MWCEMTGVSGVCVYGVWTHKRKHDWVKVYEEMCACKGVCNSEPRLDQVSKRGVSTDAKRDYEPRLGQGVGVSLWRG